MTHARPRRPLRSAAAAAAVALAMGVFPVGSAANAASVTPRVMTPQLEHEISAMTERFREQHGIPGISVAIVTPDPNGAGAVVTTFASGVPELGSPLPVDASTQFELGSETKIFTADLLAYVVADGRVSLDDRVQQFAPTGITVPEFVDPSTGERTPITLRDLATHQAALPDDPANMEAGCGGSPCQNWRPGYTEPMLWDAVANVELPWKPGTNYYYSDFGFGLLGTILSTLEPAPPAPPSPFQSALDAAFLDALEMDSTVLETPDTTPATPYAADGTPTFRWDNTNAFAGGGGLISSAADMGTLVATHLGYVASDAPLGVRTMPVTVQPVSTITHGCASHSASSCYPVDFHMGLAWQLYGPTADIPAPYAYKNGGTAGTSTDTMLVPSRGVGVTTLHNRIGVQEQLASMILRLLLAETPPPPAPAGGGAALAESGGDSAWAPALSAVALIALGCGLVATRALPRRRRGLRHRESR